MSLPLTGIVADTAAALAADSNGHAADSPDHIAQVNPFRYRGYYYDNETGLYYLNSRYYDPETGRFINADLVVDNRGLTTPNLFQYCANNPVNFADVNGNLFGAILAIGIITIGLLVLSGCDNTSSTVTTMPNTPSTTNPVPTSPANSTLTYEQKVFVATIAAEARWRADKKPVSSQARRAMAHVAINRLNSREWKGLTLPEICANGFDAYGNSDYLACMDYLNNRNGGNNYYEQVVSEIIPIYNGEVEDITGGCQLYYTPASMKTPGSSLPDWDFSRLEEVTISGVDPFYEGRFYRYR